MKILRIGIMAACFLSGCILERGDEVPDSGSGYARLRFPPRDWMNVEMDTLVIEDQSPEKWIHVFFRGFNPYEDEAGFTFKAFPGQSLDIVARCYKRGRVVAESRAQLATGDSRVLEAGSVGLVKLPAWDSLIPVVPAQGHLAFDPPFLEIPVPERVDDTLHVWNRHRDTLGYSVQEKDAWVTAIPDTAIGILPGRDRAMIISVDTAAMPAARFQGLLVLRSEQAVDTVRLRYRQTPAPGRAWLRLSVTEAETGKPLPQASIRTSALADTAHSTLLRTDAFGEALDRNPALGPAFLVLASESRLSLIDTTRVTDGDTVLRTYSLAEYPSSPAFDFGIQTAITPIHVLDGYWVVASQSLAGEGLVAYVKAGSPASASPKTLRQGNVDSLGSVLLMADMAVLGEDLYLTYPTDGKMVRIRDWREQPSHELHRLPFQPYHVRADSGRLLITGADSSGAAVLAIATPDSFPSMAWKAYPGVDASGVDLGLWGPRIGKLDDGSIMVLGQGSDDRGALLRILPGSLVADGAGVRALEDCDGKAFAVSGSHLLCLDARDRKLARYDREGVRTGGLGLSWEPRELSMVMGSGGREAIEVVGREGERVWVDGGWMRVLGKAE